MIGERAVVVGAGHAGLVAASALSKHFENVVIVERDLIPEPPDVRPGVPQSGHIHVFQLGALWRLEERFAGFRKRAVELGAARFEYGSDIRFYSRGRWAPNRESGIEGLSLTRPVLEACLREHVVALQNVQLETDIRVHSVSAHRDGRVNAVVLSRGKAAPPETLSAELVIDATGRRARACDWLKHLGYPATPELEIDIQMVYTSSLFRMPEAYREESANWVIRDFRTNSMAASLFRVEDHMWIASFSGRFGEDAEASADGMRAFAKALAQPEVYDRIKDAKPVGRTWRFRFPTNLRRRYEALESFPVGLLPVGDSIASLNPLYGQGMSLGTVHGEMLSEALDEVAQDRDPLASLAVTYFQRALPYIEFGWERAAVSDFAFEGTSGDKPHNLAQLQRRDAALQKLAQEDPEIARLSLLVSQYAQSPEVLETDAMRRTIDAVMVSDEADGRLATD